MHCLDSQRIWLRLFSFFRLELTKSKTGQCTNYFLCAVLKLCRRICLTVMRAYFSSLLILMIDFPIDGRHWPVEKPAIERLQKSLALTFTNFCQRMQIQDLSTDRIVTTIALKMRTIELLHVEFIFSSRKCKLQSKNGTYSSLNPSDGKP